MTEITSSLEPGWLGQQLAAAGMTVASWPAAKRRAAGVRPEHIAREIDHSRGLCHRPDVPSATARHIAESQPIHCLCCGGEMVMREMGSDSLEQLGVYRLVCLFCLNAAS